MNKILTSLSVLLFLFAISIHSLEAQKLPGVNVKNLKGETINTNSFDNGESPIVVSFWATWCKPCVKELTNIAEVYEDWQEETGVKVIAISIDDARMARMVRPFVDGRTWDYEIYLDENGDFKRAMNVVNIPHTFLLDKDGNIVYQHTSYADGDEEELYEEILTLSEKK